MTSAHVTITGRTVPLTAHQWADSRIDDIEAHRGSPLPPSLRALYWQNAYMTAVEKGMPR